MAQLIVRGLEDQIKLRLKRRAALHGQSMEAEARDILRSVLRADELRRDGLGTRMARRFREIGLSQDEQIEPLRGSDIASPFES